MSAVLWLLACVREPPASAITKDLKSVVKDNVGGLLYCYEKVLKTDPTITGGIELGWLVQDRYVVGEPYVIENTTGSDELATCLTLKIRRWKFPRRVQGEVSWPFMFRPE